MRYSAVLLDMDGTLVDSLPFLKKTYFDFVKKYGHESNEDEFQYFNGMELPDVVMILKESFKIPKSFEEVYAEYIENLHLYYATHALLFPGVLDFLKMLKQKKIKTALVTSSDGTIVDLCLERTKILEFLDVVITPTELLSGKPSPLMYLEAIDRLKVLPQNAAIIEDSRNGLEAAIAAKITTYHIFDTSNSIISYDGFQVIAAKNWQELIKTFSEDL